MDFRTHITEENGRYAFNLVDQLTDHFGAFTLEEAQAPATIRLDEYPAALVNQVLSNETSHPLIVMAHIDKQGFPFMTVMGFTLIDGKVHIPSRKNGLKLRRLAENPRCSVLYHSNIARPEGIASVALVGRASVTRDPGIVLQVNELLSAKVFRDGDPDARRRPENVESMQAADRTVIVLEDVDGVYFRSPTAPDQPPGRPGPPLSWRRSG